MTNLGGLLTANDTSNTKIELVDTTLRDGHQSLWATRMTTRMMRPVLEDLDNAGFAAIDLMGLIHFDVCVRYLREDPWQRIRTVSDRIQKTPVQALIRSKNLIRFDFLPDDIIELWVERLAANGIRRIMAFDALADLDNLLVSLRPAKKLGMYTAAALVFSESPVHTDCFYEEKARLLAESRAVDALVLKDSGGLLTLDRIRTIVPALKAAIGDLPLEIHSHCLTGLAPLVYVEAAKLGANRLHTSIAPLANGSSLPSTQQTMKNLEVSGFSIDVQRDLIDHVSEHFFDVAKRTGKPIGAPVEYDAFHYQHQIPGGMLTNLHFQLESAGISERFTEVLEECSRIREDLGWPIMVTPFAQFVASQAVLNVLHGERYQVVPDEVKKYALGYYGQLLAPVEPSVLDRIVENGSKRIPLNPSQLPPGVPELRKKYPKMADDERLLRLMFAGSQVDEMIRARTEQPAPDEPEDDGLLPILQRIPEFNQFKSIRITKGDLRLALD